MDLDEVLIQLKKLGTEQNIKIYKNHGVGDKLFGVSFANIKKLAKKIKTDKELAIQLWETKNHDAKILATMIFHAPDLTIKQANKWSKDLNNYVITDSFSQLVSQSTIAKDFAIKYRNDDSEWKSTAAWNIISHLAIKSNVTQDDFFIPLINEIEERIHSCPNRTRYSMNSALISIGLRNEKLEKIVLSASNKIGRVHIDHGKTNCKTPYAPEYIQKAKVQRLKIKKKK